MSRQQVWKYAKIGAGLALCLVVVSRLAGALTGFHALFLIFAVGLALVVARLLTRR